MLPFVLAFLVVVILYVFRYYQNVGRYPKGPTPVPLFGNLFQLDFEKIHLNFKELSKKYGPVFTVFLPKPAVVLTNFECIREALVKKGDDFAGRTGGFPENVPQVIPNGGVVFADGDSWKEQRRTSLHILRDFGMGKNLMEEQIMRSVQELIIQLRNEPHKERVELRWPIQLCVANVITETLFGFHYNYGNCEDAKPLMNAVRDFTFNFRKHKMVFIAQSFPFILRLPLVRYLLPYRTIDGINQMKAYIRKQVDKQSAKYDLNAEPNTFAQAYLREMDKGNKHLSYDQLVNVSLDFWAAGFETTSTTLRFAGLYLIRNPTVQDKMREEIFRVVGRDRYVCMSDKPRMPYCSAALMELQRSANILSVNLVHKTTADTSVAGLQIPRDTYVMPQIHTVHTTDSVFQKPQVFEPARFLNEDGCTFKKEAVERLVPFSMGKRQCAGEPLARMELFLILVTLVQKFELDAAPGEPLPDTEPLTGGFIASPKPYLARIVPL